MGLQAVSADADEVTGLARLYDSAACQRRIWERPRRDWYRMARPIAYSRLALGKQEVQYLHVPPARRVGYVMNQKAASTWITQTMCAAGERASGTDRLFRAGRPANCTNRMLHTDRDPGWGAGDEIFTFVRSPTQTALSAYLEVARRSNGMPTGRQPRYRNMSCATARAATDRFEAYLDDVERGGPLGGEAVHSFPQANKIFFPPSAARARRFSAIGRLESLQAHLAQMRSLFRAEPPRADETTVVGHSHNQADARGRGTTRKDGKSPCSKIDWERESLLLRLCRVYRADFACFNYTLPEVCLQHDRAQLPGLAAGQGLRLRLGHEHGLGQPATGGGHASQAPLPAPSH